MSGRAGDDYGNFDDTEHTVGCSEGAQRDKYTFFVFKYIFLLYIRQSHYEVTCLKSVEGCVRAEGPYFFNTKEERSLSQGKISK